MAAGTRVGDLRSHTARPQSRRRFTAHKTGPVRGCRRDLLAGVGGQLRSWPSGLPGRQDGAKQPKHRAALARPYARSDGLLETTRGMVALELRPVDARCGCGPAPWRGGRGDTLALVASAPELVAPASRA